MTYNFGDVLICLFPFSNHAEQKKRPVVVISTEEYHKQKEDLIVLAITSKVDKLLDFEAIIEDWDDAGNQLKLVQTVKSIVQTNA